VVAPLFPLTQNGQRRTAASFEFAHVVVGRRHQAAVPNANDRGSHVNISGMALAKNAPHKAGALKLMGYLVSEQAQKIYATASNEYPAGAIRDRQKLGTLKPDPLPLENIAKYRKKASELVDKINTLTRGPSS
jgi:iron(III) transport system substrate-binding protein